MSTIVSSDGGGAGEVQTMNFGRVSRWSVTLLSIVLLGCTSTATPSRSPGPGASAKGAGAIDDARMLNAANEPENWLINGGTFQGGNYSGLDQINIDTVKDLKPAWSFEYDTYRNQEAEPIVVDGVMYVSTSWSKVYALDAVSGEQIWFYDPKVPGEHALSICCDAVNRGVSVYEGKVYLGTLDGRLIAIDAATGQEVWSAQTTDPTSQLSITGVPRVAKGLVIIGNAGADFGVRGYVSAYDAATGKQLWRFYLAPGDPAKGPDGAASDEIMETLIRPTWSGDGYYKYGGGATAWQTIMYDPEFDRVYVGTGNGSPWNPKYRTDGKGDNLFLCSIVALDLKTGKYVWHYQENPQEAWDYNSTQPMILTDLTIEGQVRKVLMHAPKNGFFYVIDRTNGKLISAENFVPVTWATRIDIKTGRPVEAPNARYTEGPFLLRPSTSGGHNWHAISRDPTTGFVFLGVAENEVTMADNPDFKPAWGQFNGGQRSSGSAHLGAYLIAWDPVGRKVAWRKDYNERPFMGHGGGTLATAGGLVFQGHGSVTGAFTAMRATDGKLMWSWKTPNGIQAAPVTYMVDGVQYVAVSTGAGAGPLGGDKDARVRQSGRMVVFRLNGTATLPPDPDLAPLPQPSNETFAPQQVKAGQAVFNRFCSRCHGGNGVNSNVIPDVRRSAFVNDKEGWRAVVMEGALTDAGMVGWKPFISEADSENMRAFIHGEAVKLAGSGARHDQTIQAEGVADIQ